MNILKNPWQTAGAGIVLAVVLNVLLGVVVASTACRSSPGSMW